MRKYKILRIVTNADNELSGGVANHVYRLSTKINRKKFVTTVACGRGKNLISKLEREKVKVISIPTLVRNSSPIHDFLTLIKLYRIIRNGNYDIVATHSTKAGLLGRVAAYLAKAPIIIFTAHGFIFNEPSSYFKKQLFIFIEWLGAKFSHKILTVSNYDKKNAVFNQVSKAYKLETIYNGIDVAKFDQNDGGKNKEALNLSEHSIVIGSVANFYPNKGLQYLIEGLPELIKMHPNMSLLLAGDGPLKSELMKRAKKLGLADKILFLGYVNNIPQVIDVFDVFVLPSLKEGFPWVILEAMASRKAIVATEVGGIPEMILDGESGILIRPGDIDSLISGIHKILIDPQLREKLGRNARKRVERQFTLKRMIEETEILYDKLIRKRVCLNEESATY